jgi:hypothetical protein
LSRILAWNEKVRDNGDEKRKIQGREKRMKIRRVVLTVVLLPVLLAMKALIFLCLFLTAVSNGLLSIVSSLLGMTALVSIFLIPIKSALILFVSAWLISPAGLPLAAQKLLEVLYAGCERMQDWMMG